MVTNKKNKSKAKKHAEANKKSHAVFTTKTDQGGFVTNHFQYNDYDELLERIVKEIKNGDTKYKHLDGMIMKRAVVDGRPVLTFIPVQMLLAPEYRPPIIHTWSE